MNNDALEARMDAIRLKHILGHTLTEQELMCLQIEEHGFGCHAGMTPSMLAAQTRWPST